MAAILRYPCKIDIAKRKDADLRFKVGKGDTGYVAIDFEIVKSGVAYDLTDKTIVLSFRSPETQTVGSTATVTYTDRTHGKFEFLVDSKVTLEVGPVQCMVKIYDGVWTDTNEDGDIDVGELTAYFIYSTGVLTFTVFDTFSEAIDPTPEQLSLWQTWVVAESGRVQAEELRQTAESGRVTLEIARQTAETARGTAEGVRQTAEGTRQTNETARILLYQTLQAWLTGNMGITLHASTESPDNITADGVHYYARGLGGAYFVVHSTGLMAEIVFQMKLSGTTLYTRSKELGYDFTDWTNLLPVIVNDLITGGVTKVLSAEQGKLLNTSKAEKTKMFYPDNTYGNISLEDPNLITMSGFYTCPFVSSNIPSMDYNWFIIHENSNTNNNGGYQLAIAITDIAIKYERFKFGGTWGAWTKPQASQIGIANTEDYFESDTVEDALKELMLSKPNSNHLYYADNIFGMVFEDNVNTMVMSGPYHCNNMATGVPSNNAEWFVYHFNQSDGYVNAFQIANAVRVFGDTVKLCYRIKNDETWGPWTKFGADQIGVADAGNYFTGTDVESVLQEVGSTLGDVNTILDYVVGGA